MSNYTAYIKHRPPRGYKSKTTSQHFSDWIDWYRKREPACLEQALRVHLYHGMLKKLYPGVHEHNTRAIIQENIIARITNEFWYENQDIALSDLRHYIGMMPQHKFILLCDRALAQPKARCNDKPLTG